MSRGDGAFAKEKVHVFLCPPILYQSTCTYILKFTGAMLTRSEAGIVMKLFSIKIIYYDGIYLFQSTCIPLHL